MSLRGVWRPRSKADRVSKDIAGWVELEDAGCMRMVPVTHSYLGDRETALVGGDEVELLVRRVAKQPEISNG